jgi:hypothetical protein
MLDSHSDLLARGSVDSDYNELTIFVGSSGSFPLMNQNEITIKPGFYNETDTFI